MARNASAFLGKSLWLRYCGVSISNRNSGATLGLLIGLILLGAVLIVLVLWQLEQFGRRGFADRVTASANKLLVGGWVRLRHQYAQRYDFETAGYLAASVVNHLHQRGTSAFEQQHPDVVARELAQVRLDQESRTALTQAALAMGFARTAMGTPDPLREFEHLRRLGFLDLGAGLSGRQELHEVADRFLAESQALVSKRNPA